MLDLSNNQINIITGIDSLINIKHLNLSYNKLTQVDSLKGCVALEKLELQGNQIKDTRTFESAAPGLGNLRILYLQEFNQTAANPVCGTKAYRKRMIEILPKLKALDGYREGAPVLEPGNIDIQDAQGVEYKCKEDWFTPEIYLANPGKTLFHTTNSTQKDEQSLKDVLKDCENLLNRKTNVLTL